MGSYNFSNAADVNNGENLVVIRDRRVATSYMVEALSMFDHYHFRVVHDAAKDGGRPLELQRPPAQPGDKPWFAEDWEVDHLIRDRLLFA
jgi:phosphatidylserine/phosphatidylglycerophosphate/cardiolipin synthase-like enzyme